MHRSALLLAGCLALTTPALAQEKFASPAELAAAMQAGTVVPGDLVEIERARLNREPLETDDPEGASVLQLDFEGATVNAQLPLYYYAELAIGHPDLDPEYEEVEVYVAYPVLKRGYTIKLLAQVRDAHTVTWSWTSDGVHAEHFYEVNVEYEDDEGYPEVSADAKGITVLDATHDPQGAPENLVVHARSPLRPGHLFMVTAENLDPGHVIATLKAVEGNYRGRVVPTLRSEGQLGLVIPSRAGGGEFELTLENPGSQESDPVLLQVNSRPKITSAVRVGRQVAATLESEASYSHEVSMKVWRFELVDVRRTGNLIIGSLPSDPQADNGHSVRVTVNGVNSRFVRMIRVDSAAGPSSTTQGLSGSVPTPGQ